MLAHGHEQDADQMLEMADRLALRDVAYAVPVAPGGAWYPGRFDDAADVNEPGLSASLNAYEHLVLALRSAGWTRDSVVLVGFSQGAFLTLEHVARRGCRYRAVAALTGGLIGPDGGLTTPPHGCFAGMPVLATTKERAAWAAPDRTRESAAILADAGAAVYLRVLPGDEHTITDDEVDAVRRLIAPQASC